MIQGVFNGHEARVPLVLRGPNGNEQGVAAILDTGFTGYLTIPLAVVEALGLVWRGLVSATVGDGGQHLFDVYHGTILWDDQAHLVEIAAAETEPLLGISMLYGHNLGVEFVEDGLVMIESKQTDLKESR